ncbi:MAG: hypothetical protein QM811_19560 [Pirellulales bacterium]
MRSSGPSLDATTTPAPTTAPCSTARNSYTRLARAPSMFGDSPGPSTTLSIPVFNTLGVRSAADTTVPLGGGSGATKIAENGCTLPADRVFFNYNQYAGVLATTRPTIPTPTPVGDGRYGTYTLGVERTFLDGDASVEVRMPFHDDLGANFPGYQATIGNVGNLAVYLKTLLYADEGLAVGAGIAGILPTGNDLRVDSPFLNFEMRNEAVHLAPYLAALYVPDDDWFVQGFIQGDFAANGNTIFTNNRAIEQGVYTEQNLLLLDLSLGRWLYHDPNAERFVGAALVFELHYTTTLQDTDVVPFGVPTFPPSNAAVFNSLNRLDVLNATVGCNFLLTPSSNLRIGAGAPVTGARDRLFDGEFQVSFNQYY